MAEKFDAIKALAPNAVFAVHGGNVVEWYESNTDAQPTESEIAEKLAELQAAESLTAYKDQRAAEYPPLAEQLDYIYHNGVEAWKTDIIDPIKARYPKP